MYLPVDFKNKKKAATYNAMKYELSTKHYFISLKK